MNRQKLSALVLGISAAIFGILYPEYVLLSDTYEYIGMEMSGYEESVSMWTQDSEGLRQILMAEPEQIEISSYFLEKLNNKGLVLWKNVEQMSADMP